ncbi:unnamed protein product, partial [Trichogramma brassicae]
MCRHCRVRVCGVAMSAWAAAHASTHVPRWYMCICVLPLECLCEHRRCAAYMRGRSYFPRTQCWGIC